MIDLYKFKSSLESAQLNNKKFIIIIYNKVYYNISEILYKEKYIKNFIYIVSNITNKNYILLELFVYNNFVVKFKINVYNTKLKFTYKSFANLRNLKGLFIINTSYGVLTLDQIKFLKIGGVILLHIL